MEKKAFSGMLLQLLMQCPLFQEITRKIMSLPENKTYCSAVKNMAVQILYKLTQSHATAKSFKENNYF